jgi:hypothetical protein
VQKGAFPHGTGAVFADTLCEKTPKVYCRNSKKVFQMIRRVEYNKKEKGFFNNPLEIYG